MNQLGLHALHIKARLIVVYMSNVSNWCTRELPSGFIWSSNKDSHLINPSNNCYYESREWPLSRVIVIISPLSLSTWRMFLFLRSCSDLQFFLFYLLKNTWMTYVLERNLLTFVAKLRENDLVSSWKWYLRGIISEFEGRQFFTPLFLDRCEVMKYPSG